MAQQLFNDDQTRIIFYDDLWRVLRPDGLYFFKEVWSGKTEIGATEFCDERGWEVIRD